MSLTIRAGNLRSLRCTAFDCLLVCKPVGRSTALANYLLQVIKTDPSLVVRRHVATSLSESILMALAVGDVYMPNPGNGIVDNAETDDARKQRADMHNKSIVKALRREFSDKSDVLSLLEELLM